MTRVQINMANSTSALSGLIDATQGLDSLHLDGLSYSRIVTEDLTVEAVMIQLHLRND